MINIFRIERMNDSREHLFLVVPQACPMSTSSRLFSQMVYLRILLLNAQKVSLVLDMVYGINMNQNLE